MKLKIHIRDNETGTTEILDECLDYASNDTFSEYMDFVRVEEHHNVQMLAVLVNEGYTHTWYYYPLDRYQIVYIGRYDG